MANLATSSVEGAQRFGSWYCPIVLTVGASRPVRPTLRYESIILVRTPFISCIDYVDVARTVAIGL